MKRKENKRENERKWENEEYEIQDRESRIV